MQNLLRLALILLFVFAAPAWADDEDEVNNKLTLFGNYVSVGPSCEGKTSIIPSYIAWTTPDSICAASDYGVLDSANVGNEMRMVYVINRPSVRCKYKVWVLTHANVPDPLMGWKIQGYENQAAYQRQTPGKSVTCDMVKVPPIGSN